MTEGELTALGVHRIPIPVPFPQAGGPVNAYLVEERGGGLLMFDAGLGTPEAEAALAAGFERAGHRFDAVTRIVLSHGHVDHYGAARTVLERAGQPVQVFAHAADVPKISESGRRFKDIVPHLVAYLGKLGVPADALAATGQRIGKSLNYARRLPEVTPLAAGEVLTTAHLELEVRHMPGHTPGLLCLHDRARGLFFAGDHLLEKVSPNPIIELGPDGEEGHWRPLVAYLASLAELRALDVELVLPGHGPPFGGHRQVIDALVGFYAKRQERILEALSPQPLTAYEVGQALFPRAISNDLFLAISETIANLEVLEARGAVARETDGDVYRFRRAG